MPNSSDTPATSAAATSASPASATATSAGAASAGTKLPAAEVAKLESRGLRSGLAETLAASSLDDETDAFTKGDLPVLKFHGIYQQENRDTRAERRAAGLGKSFTFMVRVAIPGGALTPEQYLSLDRLADLPEQGGVGDGSLRLTTRQGIQFHGVLLGDLRQTVRAVDHALLTTFAACGDVRRNVMACPAPLPGGARAELQRVAADIARELEPKTRAYHDIWIDGEKQPRRDTATDVDTEIEGVANHEPFYGDGYLPRKFKIALASEDDNCIDAYTQDCALVAIVRDDAIIGYNLLVGGGLGMTHNRPDTVARMATPLGFIDVEHAVEAVRTVAAIFRDHGNRHDRRHARLKYLIEDWGLERFRTELLSRVEWTLGEPVPVATPHQHDHLGEHAQAVGGVFYGLWIENGRLRGPSRDAVREIVERFAPGVRVTAGQSLLFTDLEADDVPVIEEILAIHGLPAAGQLPEALRGSMACPALPTCGLALADAERHLPSFTRQLAARLETLGVRDVPLVVRMTGCPNGCARPYNADIGLVGRRPGVYHLYVGGGVRGDRLADLWQGDVEQDQLVEALEPLLVAYGSERLPGEGLSDFYQRRLGRERRRHLLSGREESTASTFVAVTTGAALVPILETVGT